MVEIPDLCNVVRVTTDYWGVERMPVVFIVLCHDSAPLQPMLTLTEREAIEAWRDELSGVNWIRLHPFAHLPALADLVEFRRK